MDTEDFEFGFYDSAERHASDALSLYEDGKITQALARLDKAIEANPMNSSWHFNKALMLDSAGRFKEAITQYETALQLNPNDLEALNCLAMDYTRTCQYDLAISTFEDIESMNPLFEPCYCNRVITYTETCQHDLAEQMFYLAQQIEPNCPLCFYNIGNSLFIRGLYAKAVRCWLRTAELDEKHPQINYRIAQAYWCTGDIRLARKHFLAELRVNPGDVDVILDFGLLLLEINERDSAREKFNRALELKDDCAAAFFYLGEILMEENRGPQASEMFRKALEKNGELKGPRYRLAQQALAAGNTEQASTHLANELYLEPEDGNVLYSMGLMFLYIAAAAKTAKQDFIRANLDNAQKCLRRTIQADLHKQKVNASWLRDSGHAYHYLAISSAMKGQFQNACEQLENALDIRPADIGILVDAGLVNAATGRRRRAVHCIAKALRQRPHSLRLHALSGRMAAAELMRKLRRRKEKGKRIDQDHFFAAKKWS